MDDSLFGPWSLDPPVNKWNEWKIGKLDSWYAIAANSLQSQIPSNSSPPPTNEKNNTSSTTPQKDQQSMIPRSKRAKQMTPREVISPRIEKEIINEINNPPLIEPPKCQPRFPSKESWDEPRSFDVFISSSQYQLSGWPINNCNLEVSIGSAQTIPVKPPSGKSPKQRRSQIPMKKK